MEDNFNLKIKSISEDLAKTKRKLRDIIIMASIIEEEAKDEISRKIVSGILWRRIDIGMALQVDASFLYVNGKKTHDLTLEDLAIDSPYNTYKYAGLPPGAITNPGIDSILAAVYPTKNPYLYYLTGTDGKMYYAKSFEEHIENKRQYLK
jgi:UPF0755 protein